MAQHSILSDIVYEEVRVEFTKHFLDNGYKEEELHILMHPTFKFIFTQLFDKYQTILLRLCNMEDGVMCSAASLGVMLTEMTMKDVSNGCIKLYKSNLIQAKLDSTFPSGKRHLYYIRPGVFKTWLRYYQNTLKGK